METFTEIDLDRIALDPKQNRQQQGTPRPQDSPPIEIHGPDSARLGAASTERRKSYFMTGQTARAASSSTPDLSRPPSHLTPGNRISSHSRGSSGTEDDDDDIPLGILAAQGFPSKNKNASRADLSAPGPVNRRGSMPLSPSSLSVAGAGSRGSLPVFARNLPQDPYSGRAGMADPQAQMGPAHPMAAFRSPPPHPSGLVGVIAGEEQARALRRGSSNQHFGHDSLMGSAAHPAAHPGMMSRSSTMNVSPFVMNGYPSPAANMGMASPAALSPGDHAQMQMAQQMNQMMQLQMQWMQQMTHMQQSGQVSPMPPPQPGVTSANSQVFPDAHRANHLHQPRPSSMPLPEVSGPAGRSMNLGPDPTNPWTRNSSYGPAMGAIADAGAGAAYAPSLAPSERNTIGMASRYRPVSVAIDLASAELPPDPTPSHHRASSFSAASALNPQASWAGGLKAEPPRPANPPPTHVAAQRLSPGASGSGSGSGSAHSAKSNQSARADPPKDDDDDDDDDDKGWAEMKKQRDRKKTAWQSRRRDRIAIG